MASLFLYPLEFPFRMKTRGGMTGQSELGFIMYMYARQEAWLFLLRVGHSIRWLLPRYGAS